MSWLKENWLKLTVIIIVLVALIGFFNLKKNLGIKEQKVINNTILKKSSTELNSDSTALLENLSDAEIKNQIDEILKVLMSLHYISLADVKTTNSDTVILDELKESMDDVNKLQGLLLRTEPLSKSSNKTIAVTGLSLHVTTLGLINSYNSWIKYLREVDMYNVNLSEFQYQIALFGSSTHDIYLKLAEGVSLLPYIVVEFAKNDTEKSLINENLKSYFLSKIDELFSDILKENEAYYKKTKSRYVVPIIIQGYKDFLIK